MTALLALLTITSWGLWIPVAQAAPGVSQPARIFYATVANLAVASAALLAGGGPVSLGWKPFWLPLVGGLVWVAGNYSAFRAAADMGMARANGTWAPLNIIVGFAWGAALFGELSHLSAWSWAGLVFALAFVVAGVLLIVGAQDQAHPSPRAPVHVERKTMGPAGVLFAVAAGVLWGSYFIPSQWAGVTAQVGNFPLALGMLAGSCILAWVARPNLRLEQRALAVQLSAGVLFGAGQLCLLALVARVGTGVGFTLAQLALLVTAGIGIFVLHAPPPSSAAGRRAMTGILLAGAGGIAIGALK